MSSWPHVGIVGGSLGGLTAALVLRDLGCEVDVFERSSEALKARGAGIATHPSTTRYFEESSELVRARDVPLRERRARPPGAHELPLLVVDHGVPRPHGRLRRPALPPRLGGRPLRAGRPRGHRPIRGRVQPHPRPAGARGRHLVHLPHDASPGRRAALRGLCRVAGDDPGIRPRAGELRGAPRRSHLLRAPGRTRPRLPDPEPRGAPRAGAAARELCLLPQLR